MYSERDELIDFGASGEIHLQRCNVHVLTYYRYYKGSWRKLSRAWRDGNSTPPISACRLWNTNDVFMVFPRNVLMSNYCYKCYYFWVGKLLQNGHHTHSIISITKCVHCTSVYYQMGLRPLLLHKEISIYYKNQKIGTYYTMNLLLLQNRLQQAPRWDLRGH